MVTDQQIIESLPHEKPRPGQVEAIRLILDSFSQGKRFVILEGPTGSGKSAIGMTVSEFYKNSFYLTVQKLLQSQLNRDYSSDVMVELKGRNAYDCNFFRLHGDKLVNVGALTKDGLERAKLKTISCDRGYCKVSEGKSSCKLCFPTETQTTCPYFDQVAKATNSKKVLMNFSSFLYQIHYTGRFEKRELLIIDEAHQCESQIMDFVSVTISDLPFLDHGISLPKSENPGDYAIWIHDHKILELVGSIAAEAREVRDLKREEEFTRLYQKLNRFMRSVSEDMENWVCEYEETKIGGQTIRTATMKPVFVSSLVSPLLFEFGDKILLMSATILDHKVMCKSLGMKESEVAFHQMENRFPKENRPIYLKSAGIFTGGNAKMGAWGPKLVAAVDEIVAKYPDNRGIIHTHNFAIADLLMTNSGKRHRYFYQKDFESKEVMLQEHGKSKNGVIVAPAMAEGLDLRGDLSRFQIICKVPWPNYHQDKQLAKRFEIDKPFMFWLVVQKLVQSYGRSIRSETDWAHTYIIDGAIKSLMSQAKNMFPSWFKEAITTL